MTKSTIKIVLLSLFAAGVIIPYYFLISHIAADGFTVAGIYNEIIASRLSIFAWVDVIISAVVLLFFMIATKSISGKQMTAVLVATCFVGVSAGLPLLLYFIVDSGTLTRRA